MLCSRSLSPNCSGQGYYLGSDCFGNDLSGSVVSNFLRIRVVGLSGIGVSGVDVMVASGGVVVYASPGYGGGNASTGVDGCTGWFAVPYQRYSGVVSSGLVVEVWVSGFGYRWVDMSGSHTETFSEAERLLTVMVVFLAASQGSQGVPIVVVIGRLIGVVLAGFALALHILRRKT
nr:hypothetical protein [Candidatus Freyarchaeota archaeon]